MMVNSEIFINWVRCSDKVPLVKSENVCRGPDKSPELLRSSRRIEWLRQNLRHSRKRCRSSGSSITQTFSSSLRSSRITENFSWWQNTAKVENCSMRSPIFINFLRRKQQDTSSKFLELLRIVTVSELFIVIWSPRMYSSTKNRTTFWRLLTLEPLSCIIGKLIHCKEYTGHLTTLLLRFWNRYTMKDVTSGQLASSLTSCFLVDHPSKTLIRTMRRLLSRYWRETTTLRHHPGPQSVKMQKISSKLAWPRTIRKGYMPRNCLSIPGSPEPHLWQ